jgi:hypothetical protein
MAEPDSPDRRCLEHGAGKHGHRVGIVEEPGIRADVLHLAGECEHYRNGPQCTEYAAYAERKATLAELMVEMEGEFSPASDGSPL